MKSLTRLLIGLCACNALAFIAYAGPESLPSDKEIKQVAPAPLPECDWTGFYFGILAGGQFGHSENRDLDGWLSEHGDAPWGYSESGAVVGGQVGYNFQWHWLVLGPEFDLGYMNLNGGRGQKPGTDPSDYAYGESNSDFYTTFRGRIGVPLDWQGCWLIYATGGGIGVNYDTRFSEPSSDFSPHTQDFDWGYTVGGGIERKIGKRWSLKVEYLYFDLDTQTFSGVAFDTRYRFDGETAGHIVRAGLNFHF